LADAPDRPKHDPWAALRQPNFVLFTSSRLCYAVGQTLMQAAMLWQVYDISGSALNLGLLGLARLIPSLALGLVAGAVADSYNRRNIVMAAQTIPFACSIVLATSTISGWVNLELIYGLVVLMGLAGAFEGPARAALLPAIVKPETFANAVNVSSTMQSFAFVSGPAIGGVLIGFAGVGATYAVFTGLSAAAIVIMSLVRYRPITTSKSALSIAAIKEGIAFVRNRQVLLGAMALDMFAVIFGGVKALMPIYATDILEVGPEGFGILNASFEAGAFLMSGVLLMRPPVQRTGRALIWTVVFFGIGTIIFGLSRNFYLSVAVYMLIGAADQISVVMRSTTIQLATPDALRGRVSAVNQIFIQSSNQINALESGIVASLTTATFAVVSGGFGTLTTVALVAWRLPALYAYRVPNRIEVGVSEPVEDEKPSSPAAAPPNGASPPNGDTPATNGATAAHAEDEAETNGSTPPVAKKPGETEAAG
jgi:MFS family permease